MAKSDKSSESVGAGNYRSISILDRILDTLEPQIWVKDAAIHNFANGGQPMDIKIHIVDSAWITGTEYGPQFQHRYECEFYEERSVRAMITVTFGMLFDLYDDEASELHSEFNQIEMDTAGQIELFHRSGLYKHSWPRLRGFIEQAVEEFFWDPLHLPENYTPSGTPISSAYLQGLPY